MGSSLTICHVIFLLMPRRGSLQERGTIAYATPVVFGKHSNFLPFSAIQNFSIGFLTAVAFIWWLLSPFVDK